VVNICTLAPNYYKPPDLTYEHYILPIKHTQNVPSRNDQNSRSYSTNHLKQKRIQQCRQCMYKRNIEARSCKHCCSANAINITHCECACTLDIQHTKCLSHIVICGLPRCKIFFHIISQTARFSEKCCWTQNVFLFHPQRLSETFLIVRRTEWDIAKMSVVSM
jgi:hypothetical protein